MKNRGNNCGWSAAVRRITLVLMATVLSGCDKDIHNHPELVTGKQLFGYHCASCHTDTGKGNFLKGVPPNRNTSLTDWEIAHKIRIEKNDERKMPLYPNMSHQEAEMIANYVKEL